MILRIGMIIILLVVACGSEPENPLAENNEILLWTPSPKFFSDSTKIRFYNPEYQLIIVFITNGNENFIEPIHSGYTDKGNYEYWIGNSYLSDVYYVRLISSDNIQRRTMLKN